MRHVFNSRHFIVPVLLVTGLVTTVALAVNKAPIGKGNGKIAFVSNREKGERIYTMNPDGSGLTPLTDGPHQLQPSWSPDGTKIAYMDTLKDATALYVMKADGSNPKLLVSNIFHNVNLAWSPDGTKIAFCSAAGERGSKSEFSLHVINIDGANDIQLAEGTGSPSWSPDGKQIAFTTFQGIDLINADGTDHRQLVRLSTYFLHSLDWSPDGRQIVFGSSRTSSDLEGNQTSQFTVEVIAADGSDGKKARLLGLGRNPSWSPDGSKVVFERGGTEGAPLTQIWVMNSDGKDQTQLTNTGMNWSPSWQPLL